MELTTAMPTIDPGTLTPIVRRALLNEQVEITNWRSLSIYNPTQASTEGVYRVEGTGTDQSGVVSWSVILKVLSRPSDQASFVTIADREIHAYTSGLLHELASGLRAPRFYGLTDVSEQTRWLWLEDVRESPGSSWSPARYRLAGYHVGLSSGIYLVQRPLPRYEWLNRDDSRRWLASSAQKFAAFPSVREHPLVKLHWPGDLSDRVLRFWDDREIFLHAVSRLPQTLCHQDYIRRNLFSRPLPDGSEETIAIDWALVGLNAIGRDAGQLAPASVHGLHFPPEDLPEIYDLVFDGYLDGLRQAGWQGDERIARLGFTATSALRYAHMPLGVLVIDEKWRRVIEQSYGTPIEVLLDRFGQEQRFLLDRADEARQLMAKVL
jgi:hypothetical protein